MKIHKNISEINPEQWQQLIDSSPVASFFQTREWYDFCSTLSFLKPFVYAVSENDKLTALICGYVVAEGNVLKQFFSKRAIVLGGALLDENISEKTLHALLTYVKKDLKKQAIYLELRNFNDYTPFRPTFEKVGFAYQPHLNFHIATPDIETALKQLSSTKRRDVKISQKEGAEIIEITEEKDLRAYYALLEDLYKTKVKMPLFPYDFFQKLVKLSNGKIFGIKYQDQIIGGSVCVFLENRAVYELFACGLDRKFKNIYPSTLATWAGIEYAARNGYKYFDMMGAGKPDEDYGVREFKAKFGGELVEYGRFLCILQPCLYKLGKKVIQIIKSRK